jgi:hypothetical protein
MDARAVASTGYGMKSWMTNCSRTFGDRGGTAGTVSISGSNVIYTPDTDFVGTDSFTYTMSDG